MIILTAGHTGPDTGAQCAATHFDEGAENIWLRNRIAEILTNKYGLVVLVDDDKASLKLLTKALTEDLSLTENNISHGRHGEHGDAVASPACRPDLTLSPTENMSLTENNISHGRHGEHGDADAFFAIRLKTVGSPALKSVESVERFRRSRERSEKKEISVRSDDILIDIHFNAHTNPNARGAESIVANDATELELRMASRLAHATADSLEIPLRGIKTESQTPHRRLAMLHLTPQSIILEICFITSPEDVEMYRKHRRKIANTLAKNIAELVTFQTE